MAKITPENIADLKALFQDNEKALGSNFSQLIDFFNNNKVTDNGDGTYSVGDINLDASKLYNLIISGVTQQQLATKADDSKVVHTEDMRKPANDVAGIEEVNAKQDKIGYTPADDSKVVHSTVTQLNSTDMNTVLTAGFYNLTSGTNGMPNGDAWTLYQVIPLSIVNGAQVAYGTNNTILGMRSFNYTGGIPHFTSWVQFADDSKVVHDNHDNTIQINGHSIHPFDTVQNDSQPYGLDFNNYINSGNYRFDRVTTINYPSMSTNPSYWQLIVFGDGNSVSQIATGNLITAMRQFYVGAGWTSWMQVADDSKVAHLSGANNFDTVPTYGTNNKPFAINDNGATSARPTGQAVGYQYFDTTLNKPIWYTGTIWVDSTGTTV